jgi:hypothetical protein
MAYLGLPQWFGFATKLQRTGQLFTPLLAVTGTYTRA